MLSNGNNGQNNQLSLLDAISIVSFIIGVANYDENITQGTLQEVLSSAVDDIHAHLKIQDEKIDAILKAIGGENK